MFKNLLLIAFSFLVMSSAQAGGYIIMSSVPSGPFAKGSTGHVIKFYVKEAIPPLDKYVKFSGAAVPGTSLMTSVGGIQGIPSPAGSATVTASAVDPTDPYLWTITFDIPTTATPGPFSIGIDINITTDSPLPGGSVVTAGVYSNNILPIELSRFSAAVQPTAIDLSWTTLSETANKTFVIERSFNGRDFDGIGQLAGAGTTRETKNYQFADNTVLASTAQTAYYRLKNISTDGKEAVSKVIAVKLRNTKSVDVTGVYPAQSMVTFSANESTEATVSLVNLSGQVISTQTITADKGFNQSTVDFSNLNHGMYLLVIKTASDVVTKKFNY
jgi:Secretion system C-terminal sorting domain